MNNNIAIFWDLDNTYLTTREHFGINEEYLIDVIDSIHNLFKDDCIRIFRAYADYEKIRNVQSRIQKRRVIPKHVFSSNSGSDNRKNASDIELCLDALEIAIKNNDINYFVIITADKDMISLMHRLKYYGKYIHLIYLEAAISDDRLILDFANDSISLETLTNLTKKEELTEDDLNKGAQDALQVVKDFYKRNHEKTNVFLGLPFFKQDMIKKGYSGIEAETILNYCFRESILDYEDLGDNKIKIVVKQQANI
ncbi:NYN domain-containing protein [Aeribacillus composti]|uniref:NYN domain-containing protein n=1 Tax=Aeribacillus composti TaxID=1868734 RepID=UPI002E1E0E25|nr:NYN domain-containing protein [Aeribacillus composti]